MVTSIYVHITNIIVLKNSLQIFIPTNSEAADKYRNFIQALCFFLLISRCLIQYNCLYGWLTSKGRHTAHSWHNCQYISLIR